MLMLCAASLGIRYHRRAVALLTVPAAGVMLLVRWLRPASTEGWVFFLYVAIPAAVGWYWRRLAPPSGDGLQR